MRSDRRQGVTEAEFTGPATMPVLAVTLWALEGSSSSGSLLVFGHSNENNTDRDFKKNVFTVFAILELSCASVCFILFSGPSPVCMLA